MDASITTANTVSVSSSVDAITSNTPQLPSFIIEGFEKLDKWKECLLVASTSSATPPKRMVFEHNRKRAANNGFPSSIEIGTKSYGLTVHEVAALFGWTTGDYRFLNPIARGEQTVVFDDYPFLPNQLTKASCRLHRDDVLPYIHILNSALLKLPPLVSSTQILWRGHRRKLLQKKTLGSKILMKGFTSVTRDRDTALEFCIKSNEGRSKQRTLLAFVQHSTSRCISKFSARKDEMEVLFPLDTTFEVVAEPHHDEHSSSSSVEEDKQAVKEAVERLRKDMPDAEIDLVYLKEIATK